MSIKETMNIAKMICVHLFVAITTVNCSNISSKSVLEKDISEKLTEYNFFPEVNILESSKNGVTIDIYFKNKNHLAASNTNNEFFFFLDEKSNLQLIDLLAYLFNEQLVDYSNTAFELSFEGYTDRIIKSFSSMDLEKLVSHFNNTKKYIYFAEYAFKEMGYIGVLESTEMINHLDKNFSNM